MLKAFVGIFISMLLFSESFLPQGEWNELNKLPALIKHFRAHQIENPSIGFLDFLKLHYDDVNHHQEDHHTHHNLPLNHHSHNHLSCFHSLALTIPTIHPLPCFIPLREIYAVEYSEPASSFFQASIWQPPRC